MCRKACLHLLGTWQHQHKDMYWSASTRSIPVPVSTSKCFSRVTQRCYSSQERSCYVHMIFFLSVYAVYAFYIQCQINSLELKQYRSLPSSALLVPRKENKRFINLGGPPWMQPHCRMQCIPQWYGCISAANLDRIGP